MKTLVILVCAVMTLAAWPGMARAQQSPDTAAKVQRTWQMLDYMATDYAGAVRDGKVISASEYAEMREFAGTVGTYLDALPKKKALPDLQRQARGLVQAILARDAPKSVANKAHKLASALLAAYPVPSAPATTPDVAQGATIYQHQCAQCHGVRGDGSGPAGRHLDPQPIDFTDTSRADQRSPLSLYQAITQGVEGTAMRSYAQDLSVPERWDLAYYVGSLAYEHQTSRGKRQWHADEAIRAHLGTLAELSRTRVAQLAPAFGTENARSVIGWLRAHPEALQHAPRGLSLARARLQASLDAYRHGHQDEAVQLALSAYLDGVEPEEPRIDARDSNLRGRIETAMGAYRTTLSRHAAEDTVAKRAHEADALLVRAQMLLSDASSGPSATFIGAYIILVREGMEALLVVVALLAFARRTTVPGATRPIHAGWLLALGAGVATWGLARYAITISGAGRELTEGLSSLFAAAVLIGVGLWMHNKSLGGRWQAYLKKKMARAFDRRSVWLLFGLAFISVYREIFETILFYVALWNENQTVWLLSGMLAGSITLAFVAWILLRTSRRLPLTQFFKASSALIALLAVVLAGKGVAALQEAGWVNVSVLTLPRIEWLGLYPTWQSTSVQLLVIVLLVVGFVWNLSRRDRS